MRQEPSVLTSWKEIASYLGKGVRTVQRWEAQFGLPVRRPADKSTGVVLASREDLDRWLAQRWNQRPNTLGQGMEKSRELRIVHRQLVGDVRRGLDQLNASCIEMQRSMNEHQQPAENGDKKRRTGT